MRVVNGWRLFEYAAFKAQKAKLEAAVEARKAADPDNWNASPDAKLLKAIHHLTDATIPAALPDVKDFRHGGTLAGHRKHWFRARFGQGRYRLFFQFSSTEKAIIYAWVNDENSLSAYGSKTDAYAVFAAMIAKGDPPDSWDELARAAGAKGSSAASPKKPAIRNKPGSQKRKR